jgi:hypothetical protein
MYTADIGGAIGAFCVSKRMIAFRSWWGWPQGAEDVGATEVLLCEGKLWISPLRFGRDDKFV